MERFSTIPFEGDMGKKTIKLLANKAVDDMLDKGEDILKIADSMAKMETFMKEVRADRRFIDYVLGEVQVRGHKAKCQLPNGTKIEEAEAGVKYDYSACGDAEWDSMAKLIEKLDKAIKERETFLKTIPMAGMVITDEETGETRKIYPPLKTSTTTYKLTIPNH